MRASEFPGTEGAEALAAQCACDAPASFETVRLEFTLLELHSRASHRLRFARCAFCFRTQFEVDGQCRTLHLAEGTSIRPGRTAAECSVTVFTGCFDSGLAEGTALMVVNCTQEVPTLQVALIGERGNAESWTWEISHSVQHQILVMFEGLI